MPFVILLFALFASLFTFSKDTLNFAEPFFLIGSRMTFAGILLVCHQVFISKNKVNFKAKHIKPLALLSIFAIYLTNITEIIGIDLMTSSKACLIYSLSPFLAAGVAFIVLKETLNKKKVIGMTIGFLGLLPMFFCQTASEIAAGTLGVFSYGELAVLVAVTCSVYGWILLKQLIVDYKYSPIMANGISMTIGGILALGHSYLSGEAWNPVPVSEMAPFLRNTLLMCLISNIVCYNLYGFLLKRFTATFMSFAGLVTPLFAAFFGWQILGETISWHYYVSMLFFGIGLSIFYIEELKNGQAYKLQPAS